METIIEPTEKSELINTIRNSKIGDVIHFGSYDWYVYARENSVISLLCKDSVKTGIYHSSNSKMTWEKCDLRKWLNGEFYDQFSSDEKKLIVKTHLKTPWNLPFFTRGGKRQMTTYFFFPFRKPRRSIRAF